MKCEGLPRFGGRSEKWIWLIRDLVGAQKNWIWLICDVVGAQKMDLADPRFGGRSWLIRNLVGAQKKRSG